MQTNCFDILSINETRLDSTFNDSEIGIEGYTIVRRDRFRLGGGVAIYIRNSINFIIRHDLSDSVLEFLCVEIRKPKVKPFLVSTWYRPPGTTIDLFDKFEVLLNRIEATGLESDFNCNMISRPFDNPTKHLIELCEASLYTQLVKEPTRITRNSRSLIDIFLTNEPDKYTNPGVVTLVLQMVIH